MTKYKGFYKEEIIQRRTILEIPNVKTYDKYCEGMGKEKLKEIASDSTLLHLVRELTGDEIKYKIDDKPFLDLYIVDTLYGIPYTVKDKEKRSFSISAENYLLGNIMRSFSSLGIPQYRRYELSQLLRYDLDEVFYAKIRRGGFGLNLLKNESDLLGDLIYKYVKYRKAVKYFRDDEMTKFAYKFVAKGEEDGFMLALARNIHYKQRLTKNYMLFYLLYLTIYYGTELYIIYDHLEDMDCFKICDERRSKPYIEKGCTILGLYDILTNAFEMFGNTDKPTISKGKIWHKVLEDIIEASEKCTTFRYTLQGSSGMPMYGQVDFVHNDPARYDELLKYVGDFGGVIPMKGTNHKNILDGKKKLNYKKTRNNDKKK